MTTKLLTAALTGGCLFAATSSRALDVYLRADEFDKPLPGRAPVQMWGFALDNATWTAGTLPTSPGPRIDVPPTDSTLRIHLKNDLAVPVSLVIPNQNGYVLDAPHATFEDDQGRTRARSFAKETAPNATVIYQWNNLTPGTYLYHSGSHPALQVQMGLYGALVRRASATQVYPGVAAANEVLLLLSEIDADVHDAVANNDYGPDGSIKSMIHSEPQYFLINGKPYEPGQAALPAGFATEPTLLRLLNAGADTRIPVVGELHQRVIAEQGRPYPFARNLSAPPLDAMQTLDALITPVAPGLLPFYDRRLGLANATQSPGGIYAQLAVGTKIAAPTAITIPWNGTGPLDGSPSPSTRAVFGIAGTIGKVTVTLANFYHGKPQDVDLVLVAPDNTKVLLMSDVGGSTAIPSGSPVTLTFDDDAATSLTAAALTSGTYQPSNLNGGDTDTGFANLPAGPVFNSLSALAGKSPNGSWRLYSYDDASGGSGRILGGYILAISPQ